MKTFNDYHTQYLHAVEQITMFFAYKYFKNHYEYKRSDWVSSEIGGVICINDYWFSVEDMIDYMKYKYTPKQMFAHYDYGLYERTKGNSPICIRDYKKLI